ncbi:MAG: hypothetical protein KF787_10320 [Phycisphaeraceae bacterium]|nr:hypothetical protein [Phycisphaerae bacterium]MBX3393029.1 hypothetical protein [Phycisphaeraceae bacterium]
MPRRPRPITISAHPTCGRDQGTGVTNAAVATRATDTPGGRVRVAWMRRGELTWRIEFEEGREFAAALAVMDHARNGGRFALDEFEAAMLAAQILDTAQSKFRSMSDHIAAALATSTAPRRQAA